MKDMYYTPEILDIKVGYEYEFHGSTVGGLIHFNEDGSIDKEGSIEPCIKIWSKEVCGVDPWSSRQYDSVVECLNNGQIRVPYLTKDILKEEGWTYLLNTLAEKKGYTILLYKEKHDIRIWNKDMLVKFDGYCPSVNELRLISKLLNIK
jgi:hypothetical protein